MPKWKGYDDRPQWVRDRIAATLKAREMSRDRLRKNFRSSQAKALAADQRVIETLSTMQNIPLRTGGWINPSGGSELKYIDNFGQFIAPLDSSVMLAGILINGVAQGTTASSRIGQKLLMRSLMIRWTFAMQATTTDSSVGRIVVIYDRQANATDATPSQVFEGAGSGVQFLSNMNLNNRDRFSVLVDELTPPIGAATTRTVSGKIYRKMMHETVYNNGTTGSIGSINTGSVYIFFAANAEQSTAGVELTFNTRIRYKDN